MKKVLFLFLLASSLSFAQYPEYIKKDSVELKMDSFKYNGYWWTKVGTMEQIPFLTGLYDGLSLGSSVALEGFNQQDICYQTGAAAAEDFFSKLDKIMVGHIYENLDTLYADTSNLKISFNNAFKYVVYQLSGYDNVRLKQLLEAYRKEE